MEITYNSEEMILVSLLNGPFKTHTVTSLAFSLNKTRQGLWKALKKLESNKLIILNMVGNSKTSTAIIKLNWSNPITEKILSLQLTKESLKQQRWRVNFLDLEKEVDFLILFGSVLNNSSKANDIDLLAIIGDKKNFKAIESIKFRIQQTQLKKIHLITLKEAEFDQELKKRNKAYLDALKKGIVLYGQDNFIKFMKSFNK